MTGMTALLLFAAWAVVLTLIYAGYRVILVLAGKKRANSWTRGEPSSDPAFFIRTQHAHLNAVESLPVFGAIVLAAWVLEKSAVVDQVACWILAARLAQSTVHMIGTTHWLVFARANFFIIQALLFLYCIAKLVA